MMKFIKKLGKITSGLMLFCYTVFGMQMSYSAFRLHHIRQQPITELHNIIKTSLAEKNPHLLSTWVQMRPLSETDELITILTPDSGKFSPEIFLEMSRRRLMQGNIEETLFWMQLTRYRLRYDTLRCSTEDPSDVFDRLMDQFTPQAMTDALIKHPEMVKISVQRVMDFDKKYPAENDPAPICNMLAELLRQDATPLAQNMWGPIRNTMRSGTENALKDMK